MVCTIARWSDHGNRQTSVSKWLVKEEVIQRQQCPFPKWCLFWQRWGAIWSSSPLSMYFA